MSFPPEKALSFRSETWQTLRLGYPLVAAQLIYALSNFIATAMVARLGADALAASILVGTIWFSISVMFFNILNAGGILVAHQFGADNKALINRIMGQAYLLCAVVILAVLAALSGMPYLLQLSAQPASVMQLATSYMHSMMWTVPSLCYLILTEQFLAAIGKANVIMRISMIVVPLEVLLMYALIFGKWGFPACGVAGVGYGFAISYTLVSIGMSLYLWRGRDYRQYQLFTDFFKPCWQTIKEMLRIGVPMGLMAATEVSTFAIATFMIARFGTTMLAAHQLAMQFLGLYITLVFSMAQAVTVRVGHAVGRCDLQGVRYAISTGLFIDTIAVLLLAALLSTMPEVFLRIDLDFSNPGNALLIKDASHLLALSGLLLLFDNVRIILFGALRGLKDTQMPMLISALCFGGIALSAAALLSAHLGGIGVWWGLVIGIASGALLLWLRMRWLLPKINLFEIKRLS